MILAEFSITPIGKGESVSEYVSRSLDIIDRSGLAYRMGPMGTCVEGEWDEVFALIRRCRDAIRKDCSRLSITIKVDDRKGAGGRLKSKIESVEKKLGREVRK